MPLYFTECMAFGRRMVGPLIDAQSEDAAKAILDYLYGPDGSMERLSIIGEAMVGQSGGVVIRNGTQSVRRPRCDCECGNSIMVLMKGVGWDDVPRLAPHTVGGKRLAKYDQTKYEKTDQSKLDPLCKRSGNPVLMDPRVARAVRFGNWKELEGGTQVAPPPPPPPPDDEESIARPVTEFVDSAATPVR